VSVEGTPETESQLSAAVTEVTVTAPPPVFWISSDCEDGTGFELRALNERMLLLTDRCGGGAETVSVTLMVWTVPAHGLGAIQLTFMTVE
jgi:hypothetical protein